MSSYEFPGLQVTASPRFVHASGDRCVDTEGHAYVDLAMGFGVRLFGHGSNDMGSALRDHGDAAPGLGDLYSHELRERALAQVCLDCAGDWTSVSDLRASIWHTGSEAVETALKTALRATGRSRIVAFEGGYHGTFGLAMAVSAHDAFRTPFAEQLGSTVSWERWNDIPEIDERVACVIVEPVQGRAGVRLPEPGFLHELRAACTAAGALLVFDEVLTGSGRSGGMLAGGDAVPDIVALGKALGGGVPAAATVARHEIAESGWGDITGEAIHTSTWVGEPIACTGILAAHDLRADSVNLRSIESAAWQESLQMICDARGWELRGMGLMWAIDMHDAGAGWDAAQKLLREHRIVVVPSGYDGRSITLLPAALDGSHARQQLMGALTG